MQLDEYNILRDRIVSEGLSGALQTRITLYLTGIRFITIPALAGAWMTPKQDLGTQALGSQFFRETEAVAMLMRATNWSPDPVAQFQIALTIQPILTSATVASLSAIKDRNLAAVHLLALEHALLATVKLAPILPPGPVASEPFAVCLLRIEQENGRMLQTQIRLLKNGFEDIPLAKKERVIAREAAIVDRSFSNFLTYLASA